MTVSNISLDHYNIALIYAFQTFVTCVFFLSRWSYYLTAIASCTVCGNRYERPFHVAAPSLTFHPDGSFLNRFYSRSSSLISVFIAATVVNPIPGPFFVYKHYNIPKVVACALRYHMVVISDVAVHLGVVEQKMPCPLSFSMIIRLALIRSSDNI